MGDSIDNILTPAAGSIVGPWKTVPGVDLWQADPGDGAGGFSIGIYGPSPNTSGQGDALFQLGWNYDSTSLQKDPTYASSRMALERSYLPPGGTVMQSEYHWALTPIGGGTEIRVISGLIHHDGGYSGFEFETDKISFNARGHNNQYATLNCNGTNAGDGGFLAFTVNGQNYIYAAKNGDGVMPLLGADDGNRVLLGGLQYQIYSTDHLFVDSANSAKYGVLSHSGGTVNLTNNYDGFTEDQTLFGFTGSNYGGAGNGTFSLFLTAAGALNNTSPNGWQFYNNGNGLFSAGNYAAETLNHICLPSNSQILFNNVSYVAGADGSVTKVGLGYDADGVLKVSNGRASGYGAIATGLLQLPPTSGLTSLTPSQPAIGFDLDDGTFKKWDLITWAAA